MIYTNHHHRHFKYRYEVPQQVLDDQFDYQDPEEVLDGFIHYKGTWYHLDMFMCFGYPGWGFYKGTWHGHYADSFSSGVLIKCSDDGETYQIATYIR